MKNLILGLKLLLLLCISVFTMDAHGQLGFCQGNSGDPIFSETFGVGTQDSALPNGTTTYTYANGADPDDGLYTVTSNTNYFDWFDIDDHTPNDTNGRMLLVNSSFSAGEFYRTTVTGLCENTTYEFSSWLVNLTPSNGFCGNSQIPINVRFEIWDSTDTNQLASGTTGDIFGTSSPIWDQYALVFQTSPGQTSVILKMINNGSGGCGNDLAIDDIIFKSCGDSIAVEDTNNNSSTSFCSTQGPFSDTITAIPDNSVFSTHFYQWQSSTDNVNWVDIVGETNATISVTGIANTTYYRAKVAESAANLNNVDCITFSDVYAIIITQAPPPPTTECWETATFDESTCSWSVSGSQPEQPTTECWETASFNNTTCAWEVFGSQPEAPETECWETATFDNSVCRWQVTGTQPDQPVTECWEIANFDDNTCSWIVTGTQPSEPTDLECWETANFNTTTCAWEVSGSQPEQPTTACWETATFNETTCSWEVTGTQPPAPTALECWESATFNSDICEWEVSGTEPEEPTNLECWETAQFNVDTCEWEVTGTQPIEFRDEFLNLCENDSLILEATSTINNPSYQWDTGETTFSISVAIAGDYEVEVSDDCLTEIITFHITAIAPPVIEGIVTIESSIVINLTTSGNYMYSLDGINYQSSNVFTSIPSNLYTIYVKSVECDAVVSQDYFHFYIQKFITPNGDGKNDFFSINISQLFSSSEVYIYDRYGKLLFSAVNRDINWDGTFNGNPLPTSDYWYYMVLDEQIFKGHFTLKR
ncbi:MAG: T9SS type B sorting domain-containing protein [Winogradskyella sp.]|uniref:T9SS type B sorting domain-containing protein n=1 Tax=Winogradskyella sp. TaxID=1883156 RepID=UPI00184C1F6B|nr:T9SS type B sorting domain-containing protein [Winogradskyella sp.]